MNSKTKRIIALAIFCILAYISAAFIQIPIARFLKYCPKEVIITIGGFALGTPAVIIMSVLVAFGQMLTFGTNRVVEFILNVIAVTTFALPAAYAYKKDKSMLSVAIGLLSGTALMTVFMLMWNYCLTPVYKGYTREEVVGLMIPFFLPMNLLKGGFNSLIVLMLYKPVLSLLRKAKFMPALETEQVKGNKAGRIIFIIVASFFFVSYLLLILSMNKII
jgi:riboflavin transporter FmnP